ncbi:MAG: protein kinase, partial [Candidatus Aminicenantes bacterium]|nr:protein kinase [Candidatus Aminicenantes bacterium]
MTQFPDIPDYRIDKKFGKGAMGTVYLAFQEKLERYVALKVLLPDLSEDREITQRFIAEAKIGAQLQHSNIVSIYDVGVY